MTREPQVRRKIPAGIEGSLATLQFSSARTPVVQASSGGLFKAMGQ